MLFLIDVFCIKKYNAKLHTSRKNIMKWKLELLCIYPNSSNAEFPVKKQNKKKNTTWLYKDYF